GASACAVAAHAAGAGWLAVATVDEASALRDAGIEAPILVMGALGHRTEIERAIELQADFVLWRERSVVLASEAASLVSGTARVHVKLYTARAPLAPRDLDEAARVFAPAAAAPGVRLAGV